MLFKQFFTSFKNSGKKEEQVEMMTREERRRRGKNGQLKISIISIVAWSKTVTLLLHI